MVPSQDSNPRPVNRKSDDLPSARRSLLVHIYQGWGISWAYSLPGAEALCTSALVHRVCVSLCVYVDVSLCVTSRFLMVAGFFFTSYFLVFDAFVRTNRHLLPWCLSVCLSICLFGTGVHCDHMLHLTTDLSLRLDSSMFWALWHQSMSSCFRPSFSSSTWKIGGIRMCKIGEALNANNNK